MLNVLINAYAVSPNWGSEPGLGWNWIVNLSRYCNLFVITEGEWRDAIEKKVAELPQRDNIHFFYNPVSPEIREMCWNQGDWRFYKHYREWQEKTLKIAREIIAEHRIDIIHQLNMIGFREPGSLWKIKDIPFVWGPVGGYGWTTLKFLSGQPKGVAAKAIVKNLINSLQARFYPLSNNAMKHAAYVLAANSNVYRYIKAHKRKDVILMNETGCYVKQMPVKFDAEKRSFDILWVGKFAYRKQLVLALKTLAALKLMLKEGFERIRLRVVGDSPDEKTIELVDELGIAGNVEWVGKIPNPRVHEMMQQSDLFLFTSIDEGTPHVVLEAIQNNLPVACFDTCGQGDVVNERVGVKVALKNAKESPVDFAAAIIPLIEKKEKLRELKENCASRQTELSWESKIMQMVEIYEKAVGRR